MGDRYDQQQHNQIQVNFNRSQRRSGITIESPKEINSILHELEIYEEEEEENEGEASIVSSSAVRPKYDEMEFISLVIKTRYQIASSKYNEDNDYSDEDGVNNNYDGLYEPFMDRSTRTKDYADGDGMNDSYDGLYEPFADRRTKTKMSIEHNEEDEDRDEETSRRSSGSSISSILSGLSGLSGLSDLSSSIRRRISFSIKK